MRLTGSIVQPRVSDDLLTYKAIGSNYLSFVVTSMLVSTSPLDEAGTATARKRLIIKALASKRQNITTKLLLTLIHVNQPGNQK